MYTIKIEPGALKITYFNVFGVIYSQKIYLNLMINNSKKSDYKISTDTKYILNLLAGVPSDISMIISWKAKDNTYTFLSNV